jgi:hypothetical protein
VNLLKTPLRRVTAVAAGSILGLAGAAAFAAAPASAHAPSVSGSASCATDGKWNIDWKFGNDFHTDAKVSKIEIAPGDVTVTGDITKESQKIPAYSSANPDKQVSGQSTDVAASTDSVTVKVWLYWPADHYTNFNPAVATVNKPSDCVKPTDSPSPTPSETSSSPTPTPSETSSSPTPTPSETSSSPTPTPSETTTSPSTPPSETTSPTPTPSTTTTVPPAQPGEPTPLVEIDCTSMSIGLDNPADGVAITLIFKTSKGETRTTTWQPGEKKLEKFSAKPGFTVTISSPGVEESETVAYEQPDGCDDGEGGGLPVTGAAAGGIAGGAAVLLAIGGGLFFMARRRKVNFTA